MLLTAVACLAVGMVSPLSAAKPVQVQTLEITLPSIGLDGEVDLDAEPNPGTAIAKVYVSRKGVTSLTLDGTATVANLSGKKFKTKNYADLGFGELPDGTVITHFRYTVAKNGKATVELDAIVESILP